MESLKNLYKIGLGPSSSHTMGPEKAATQILKDYPLADAFVCYLYGSLALTGKGHLTDYALKKTLGMARTTVIFDINTKIKHPNTLTIEAYKNKERIARETFISVGGGSIIKEEDTLSTEESVYPFKNFNELKRYVIDNKISLEKVIYTYDKKDIKKYLNTVLSAMKKSIENGLDKEGILPGGLKVKRKAKLLYESKDNNDKEKRLLISYAYAVSEENASGNKVVTAPTCGSSGVVPAVLFYLKEKLNLSNEKLIDGLAVSGIIGNVVKTNASISGACAGCQSEIGTACSMAASMAAYLNGGDIEEIECASEIAMEHFLGLTCDPVNGLVQIPCIERNAIAALRAIDSAYLARQIKDYKKISFDTVVNTMYETGRDLNEAYRETSKGGLAKTFID